MHLDENEFFREATIRLCGSLDIQQAMRDCCEYTKEFVPVVRMYLQLFDPCTDILLMISSVIREGKMMAKAVNGEYRANPNKDLLRIVFIERVSGKGKKLLGFVRGWGQESGGVATRACWDALCIVGIGANDNDLAMAINRAIQLKGGSALSVQGKIVINIPFDLGGFISNLKIENIALRLDKFQKAMIALGSHLENCHLTLGTYKFYRPNPSPL